MEGMEEEELNSKEVEMKANYIEEESRARNISLFKLITIWSYD